MLDWRKIEAALERTVRAWGWSLDRIPLSADLVADARYDRSTINLTELAKDLAAELSHD